MPFLNWSSKLSVGVELIDTQHKKLIDLINTLHDAMMARKGRDVLGQVLTDLIDYTKAHFSAEEKLMGAHAYPASADHFAKHKDLVNQVVALQKRFAGGDLTLTLDVMTFLKDWLNNHILGTDFKLGEYLKTKGIG
ncbi:MAG: hemerythrin family protein [Candidatus Schekmanbacteria bacterium]|nr:hemerythrin family protein [Candidatus Schekmanbacteria bacterium]